MKTIAVRYDPHYPRFGLVGEPVPHKQHSNQQQGLDLYVKVINFDTGESCFKKLYPSKVKGLHFKHSGYSPTYLSDMTAEGCVVPFQWFPGRSCP
ncbi:hypothetical protein [Aestuariivirga sp.]|uniref:hypothetical protein n=1 Tax=Aestuariivirga sp. TaxID=2650926 RepID=UPI0039E378DE